MAYASRAGCNHHPLPEQQGTLPQPAEQNHFFLFIVSPTKLWPIFRQKMFLCKFWSETGIFLYEKMIKKNHPQHIRHTQP